MNRISWHFSFSAILWLCSACISPIDIETELKDDLLVVEGFITDDFGPHEIEVTRVAKFAGGIDGGTIFPVDDIEAYIIDNNGVRTELVQTDTIQKEILKAVFAIPPFPQRTVFRPVKTRYRTPFDFKGVRGNTYTLHFTLFNGRTYVSTPQTIPDGPQLDSVILQYKMVPSSDPVVFDSGVDVLAKWLDSGEQDNFYSWRVNGIYLIETPLTEFVKASSCLYDLDDGGCCNKCWINESNIIGNVLAYSDVNTNGQLTTLKVGFIKDNGLRFANTAIDGDRQYYVELEQLSINKEAFQFNELIQSQIAIDGDIFDPPPAVVKGNISNVNNPDEVIIGFFGAHSISKKGKFIKRTILENIQRWPFACGDCRVRTGSSLETPLPYR